MNQGRTLPIGGSKRLEFLRQAARGLGDVGRVEIGGRPVFLVNDGDLVSELLVKNGDALEKSDFQRDVMGDTEALGPGFGNGLLTSSSRAHKRQHRIIAKVFDRKHLERYAEAITACAEETVAALPDGEATDMQAPMMDVAIQSIGRTLLSTTFGDERAQVTEAILTITGAIGGAHRERKQTKENAAELRRHIAFGHDLADRLVLARAGLPPSELPDMLDVLFEARLEDAAALRAGERRDYLASDRQIHDEIVTMLFAGSENPKNSLCWTLWLIAAEPEIKARIFAELDAVLGDRPPTYDDVARLVYTTQVYEEALRLYPPGYAFGRRATREIQLGATTIPEGAELLVSPYLMHRREQWFPDPERFDPSRFDAASTSARPRTAYLPFGLGARACLGGSFAMLQGPLVLASLLHRFDVTHAEGAWVEARATITLRPHGDLLFRLARRDTRAHGPL